MKMNGEGLESLFLEFEKGGADIRRMQHDDMAKVIDICNQKDFILWINDHSTMKPVFVNDFGVGFYGFESNMLGDKGFEFYNSFLHPDHFNDVHRTITFFEQHPNEILKLPYIVKNYKGEWRWTYSEARAMNFSPEGKPINILAVVYDIEGLLEGGAIGANGLFIKDNLERYQSLTKREKEVLDLIANELTSQEIGRSLNIEASTVDTHRKHIIKKLHVKNSIGLVKFYLLFSNGRS